MTSPWRAMRWRISRRRSVPVEETAAPMTRADIEAMAKIADKWARTMSLRFTLDPVKVDAYLAHNAELPDAQ